MIRVEVKNGKIDLALKKWKNKVKNTKQAMIQRSNKEYVKPSAKRREEIIKAKYKQKKQDDEIK